MGSERVYVIGGGLAGCEAAWQLAQRGINVSLVEAKPLYRSPAHRSPLLCELVCSNSLRGNDVSSPAGLLKQEMRELGSLVIACADHTAVPAGNALAVERVAFGRAVTQKLARHPRVRIERRRLGKLPSHARTIVATGPLTSPELAHSLAKTLGQKHLYFYDAIAPIVIADTIDPDHSFRASRWDKGDIEGGDYINCPMDEETYVAFVEAINDGRKVTPHPFEQPKFFEGCLPIEVMAARGVEVLRHGPMRPVGLTDPRTGKWPHAVVQLRPENRFLSAYNLVGFQTRLAYPEQRRIFKMIPALANAEFARMGSIHRNTYVNGPTVLNNRLGLQRAPHITLAGLITGVEGYIESAGLGLLAGMFVASELTNQPFTPPPETTAMGGLYHHVTDEPLNQFSPSNINFGLLPPLEKKMRKRDRRAAKAARARDDFAAWLAALHMSNLCSPDLAAVASVQHV